MISMSNALNQEVNELDVTAEQIKKQEEDTMNQRLKKFSFRPLLWEIWLDFAGTTTLHGPIHLTSTRGNTRIYYAIVVLFMTVMFCTHTSYLVRHYLSFPILTEIKYNNVDYMYPDITLCPNSPFTDNELNKPNASSGLTDILNVYKQATDFWWQTNDVLNLSPNVHIKRSVTRRFFENSNIIGKMPHRHVIDCRLGSSDCSSQFIITEHSTYFRCFTLRVRPKPPVPAGPTHGIRLILHRGDNSSPLLLVNEEVPYLLQSTRKPSTLKSVDGFFIVFHEINSFPNFPIQFLPSGLALRYGMSIKIALTSNEITSVDLEGRRCVMDSNAPAIQFVKHDLKSKSNAKETWKEPNLSEFQYTQQACIAVLRQKLTHKQCNCFSESYSIPYSSRHIGQTWCHDIELSTSKLIQIDKTLLCVKEIANMTENEILANIQQETQGDGLYGCPLRCKRRIHIIHSHLSKKLENNISTENFITYFENMRINNLNKTGESFIKREDGYVKAEDLIYLDISPVSESVSQIIEYPGYTLNQFFSELGGVSGLYVGITIYTVAELLDVIIRYLSVFLPYVIRHIQFMKQNKDKVSISTA